MNDHKRLVISRILASLGKLLALLLVLFWGAFFVEHLNEWFLGQAGPWPPPFVWLAQGLHFSMIVGLALMIWREDVGTVVLVVATVAFFAVIGMREFPFIALPNLLPILCFGLARLVARRSMLPQAH